MRPQRFSRPLRRCVLALPVAHRRERDLRGRHDVPSDLSVGAEALFRRVHRAEHGLQRYVPLGHEQLRWRLQRGERRHRLR